MPKRSPSFSSNALAELRDCLGADANDVIPALQGVLAGYAEGKGFAESGFREQRDEAVRQLRSLIAALDAARHFFNPNDPDTRPPWVQDLDPLEAQVTSHLEILEQFFYLPDTKRRGRRRNEARRWLANAVGYVLQWHGIPLMKTDAGRLLGGVFHRVLLLVIEAAEGQSARYEVTPLVRETVDLFRTVDLEQLEKTDPLYVGLLRLKPTAARRRRRAQRTSAGRRTRSGKNR